jgi:hypothetical protein
VPAGALEKIGFEYRYTSPSHERGAAALSGLPNVRIVLITPDSSEIRWVSAVPEPGGSLHSRFGDGWIIVDQVLQSGSLTYTVFARPLISEAASTEHTRSSRTHALVE